MTKHGRFLRIEQRRTDGAPDAEAETETADRARIAAVIDASPSSRGPDERELETAPDELAGTGDAREPIATGASLDDLPREDGAIEIALDEDAVRGQPFVRCARCGADSAMHAKICGNCAARLDTAEQRAFNEKVWDTQRERAEREHAALQEMREIRAEQKRIALRPLPDPTLGPPPELQGSMQDDDGPYLFELLLALREPKWRWAAAALTVGLPLFLATLGGRILSKLGWAMLLLLVLGMFPRSVWRRVLTWWRELRSHE